jgi:hypothetical protein
MVNVQVFRDVIPLGTTKLSSVCKKSEVQLRSPPFKEKIRAEVWNPRVAELLQLQHPQPVEY